MTGIEARDRLAAVVENLLAVDHEHHVAVNEISNLLAQPQWVNGPLGGGKGSLLFLELARIAYAKSLSPTGVHFRRDAPFSGLGELYKNDLGIAYDAEI